MPGEELDIVRRTFSEALQDVGIDGSELDGPRALLEAALVTVELCRQKLPRGVLAQNPFDLVCTPPWFPGRSRGRELYEPQTMRATAIAHQVNGVLLEFRRRNARLRKGDSDPRVEYAMSWASNVHTPPAPP